MFQQQLQEWPRVQGKNPKRKEKREFLKLPKSRFSGAKLQEMRAAFGLFDRDGDGTISVKVNYPSSFLVLFLQNIRFWRLFGLSWSIYGTIFVKVNYPIFCCCCFSPSFSSNKFFFGLFDRDGDGTISVKVNYPLSFSLLPFFSLILEPIFLMLFWIINGKISMKVSTHSFFKLFLRHILFWSLFGLSQSINGTISVKINYPLSF